MGARQGRGYRRNRFAHWAAVAPVALAAALAAAPATAIDLRLRAELAPWGTELEIEVWARFRVDGRVETVHDFPLTTGDGANLARELFVAGGDRPMAGRLEQILVPATLYVGRSCPPQQLAEIADVRPSRDRTKRRPLPPSAASRHGRWRGYVPGGADHLTFRYQCFPAAYELEETDFPPAPDLPPPVAESASAEEQSPPS